MVQGGMTFHRSSGFLELPRAGIYYVYHQVLFRRPPRDTGSRVARSRLVACIPGQDCSYLTSSSDPYTETEANLDGRYGTSKFQAGLFRFPAGAQLAILVWNERFGRPVTAVQYNDHSQNTYMGAYLVDEDLQ